MGVATRTRNVSEYMLVLALCLVCVYERKLTSLLKISLGSRLSSAYADKIPKLTVDLVRGWRSNESSGPEEALKIVSLLQLRQRKCPDSL